MGSWSIEVLLFDAICQTTVGQIDEGASMQPINISEAKANLSKLLEAIESGREQEIVIARHGRPVARLVAIGSQPVEKRIGVAKGKFTTPDSIEADIAIIQRFSSGEA
jgi:prevent-host-death family protein